MGDLQLNNDGPTHQRRAICLTVRMGRCAAPASAMHGGDGMRARHAGNGQARLLRSPGRRSARASEAELKAAFRKLAMQYHPDRNPGDKDCEHRFKEINEAYDVLKDGRSAPPTTASATPPSSRAAAAARTASAPISARPSPTSSRTSSAWAARAGAPRGRERGADLRYNMEITLEEAYRRQDRAGAACRPR